MGAAGSQETLSQSLCSQQLSALELSPSLPLSCSFSICKMGTQTTDLPCGGEDASKWGGRDRAPCMGEAHCASGLGEHRVA